MSIMKGKLRRSAVVVAFSLGAFQALSIVGANVASAAAVACTFSGGALTVQFTGLGRTSSRRTPLGTSWWTARRRALTGADMHDLGRRDHRQYDADQHQRHAGASLTDDVVTIQTYKRNAARYVTANWGTINWTVNLGDNDSLPVGPVTSSSIDNSLNTDNDVKTDWGVNGVDLNGDGEPGRRAGRRRDVDGHRRDRHGQRLATTTGARSTPAAPPSPVRPSRRPITINGAASAQLTT